MQALEVRMRRTTGGDYDPYFPPYAGNVTTCAGAGP